MRQRSHPWKWPACLGLTLALLLALVFLVPTAWIDAFFSPLALTERWEQVPAAEWIVVLPPLTVEAVPDDQESEEDPHPSAAPHRDPDWWTRGWVVRASPPWAKAGRRPAAHDSVAVLLEVLGLERDFLTRTRPDSLLAARLLLLRIEDSLRFDELKPYLSAMARAHDYADLMSRKADMFDDFLAQEIMTPD